MKRIELKVSRIGNSRGVRIPVSNTRLGKKLGALSEADARALRRLTTEMYGE